MNYPRLPLEASIDITYRCNHNCLHCWLRTAPQDICHSRELTFSEIKDIVDQARSLGVRRWSVSGGEPMLRADFPEIFDYITARSSGYTLNSNGTLITPDIARLLTRKGSKMIALYGATKETYDAITRNPDGFEQFMQGVRYLQEAGAGFMVQLIPMQANWHEWEKMIEMATSLSPLWRVGAAWLYPSSCRNEHVNARIASQRLEPSVIVDLDPPELFGDESKGSCCSHQVNDGRLFADCIAHRRDFHIDPYGTMSFCSFIKDPEMRYDLRSGSVEDGWERFIPSLAERDFDFREYMENCGTCELRQDCRWCAVYGWLEHGRYSAPVTYLCEVARETRRFKDSWMKNHCRYFRIAEITIKVECDLPIDRKTFSSKFESFAVDGPDEETVVIHIHFRTLDLQGQDLGKELYRQAPWAISRKNDSYIYLGISSVPDDPTHHWVAVSSLDHTSIRIYHHQLLEGVWKKGDLRSLTMFPTDQIIIARLLADQQGFYLHSSGAIVNGAGMLFVGHSEAGKSTTTNFLIDAGVSGRLNVEILCDDRNIVRRKPEGWRVYGTWSHGDVSLVSSSSAPIKGICFIEKASVNRIEPIADRNELTRRVLACLIRPFVTADWWEKTLDLVALMVSEVPCYRMQFDKSGAIVDEIARIANSEISALDR